MGNVIEKKIKVENHSFRLEIYPQLEGLVDTAWEIFPENYKASLYALENKQRLDKLVREKYL